MDRWSSRSTLSVFSDTIIYLTLIYTGHAKLVMTCEFLLNNSDHKIISGYEWHDYTVILFSRATVEAGFLRVVKSYISYILKIWLRVINCVALSLTNMWHGNKLDDRCLVDFWFVLSFSRLYLLMSWHICQSWMICK